ncbi:hypothetical protein [Sodalis sp. RH20]|uniref:hypothetical protein n=1 Tax=unclassified Sodalis (in: enterobacteria) TaxID=2636512 RepID=UPI0039B6AFBD
MKRNTNLILAAIFFAITGCSTSPTTSDNVTSIPTERALGFQNKSDSSATIIISRDSGFLSGGGCFVSILIDGKTAARINTSEIGKFYVEPGRHIIGISGDPLGGGLCKYQIGQPIKESSTEVSKGDVQKFRISGGTNAGLDIRPTSL